MLYNRVGLIEIEINLTYDEAAPAARIASTVRELMTARHGQYDVTIRTQEDMLATLSNILGILTAAVGALGGISLLVGGVGIVTIMTIDDLEQQPTPPLAGESNPDCTGSSPTNSLR